MFYEYSQMATPPGSLAWVDKLPLSELTKASSLVHNSNDLGIGKEGADRVLCGLHFPLPCPEVSTIKEIERLA